MKELKRIFAIGMFCLVIMACQPVIETKPIQIIPQPKSIVEKQDPPFVIRKKASILLEDESMLNAANSLNRVLKRELEIDTGIQENSGKGNFVFRYDDELNSESEEAYILIINPEQVEVRASGTAGLFYAVETIRQLLPNELEAGPVDQLALPSLEIVDKPEFEWRGMHLDVSRHFMPLDFVKSYIDYLAMNKLNVFHWHLVDGIGWRIEIKSHPELTDVGAWRVVKEGKRPWQDYEAWKEGDERPRYGGFYTQEEIKEVVAYASERHITVLPEIELPGHSEVVFECYPDLVCQDSRGNALQNIGVYCASNDQSYQLLEDVLEEVLELFPSEYIHIGGDEVNKRNWKQCANCKKLMKKNNYSADELQSHFVNHFDEYLKSKNRKLIGWHEILEGELTESATIMYWGGENGVEDYVKKGHPLVLTTGSHLYFDHYQNLSSHEPKAFGGYSSLKKVYDYNPVPENLNQDEKDRIIGVQANVWTEYMTNPERVEYMTMPRMAALAEIAWQPEGNKDWNRFRIKMDDMLNRYDVMGIHYAPSAFRPDIAFDLNQTNKDVEVSIETELISDIYYTLDGSEPQVSEASKYIEPIVLKESKMIRAIAVKDGKIMVEPEAKNAILHKARGAKVSIDPQPKGKYSAKGGYTLVDCDFGGDKWGNGKWLGVLGTDFSATMEFDQPMEVSKIGYSCIEETGAGIYFPSGLEVAVSNDGESFKTVKVWKANRETPIERSPDIKNQVLEMEFEPVSCKYLRVKTYYQKVKNQGVFVFVDEIIVN